MKNLALILFAIATLAFSCKEGASSSGLTIEGTITNASSMQVYFDKVGLNPESPNLVILKADADASGKFSLNVPDKPTAGIYRLRVGEQQIFLVLDGKENGLKVDGNLANLNQFQYEIEGCESCIAYRDIMQKIVSKQAQPADAQAFIENTPNAMAGVLVALQAFGGNPTYLDTYKKAKVRLEAAYPGSDYVRDYDLFLTSIQKVQQPSNGGFQFYEESQRQAAPDIKLKNPDGQEYALSDLKGKVVLLDFWASWCRPCRMENPNVVNIYNNYKDKGFTVFSVSLDGIDSRMEQSFAGDTKRYQEARKNEIKKWKDAIAQDGLIWPTHVSDLKKWECEPARIYGVSSIPRTFMIDKEGRIAATGLRGEQVEETLKQLL
ncbi:MAG: TlpA family protein disulfide reductase [Saprospiraceae bacterium]|nr:TlpA family protein disulfide reductase [Saprospiraceae bacterium]MCF8248321.1 TlpA family protein disulfide reductase [Saprospiraceae bacterium]MCF8280240.1 TlpA family protein disulfide reductase [Bacteroidales bacterium]MCF8309849.1 TlpA family protein disulfide reductase [Saprospiraceae bacterium]MCF8438820.1 TlpA family protein disulfide reductase [Saprospiraceae bacterium]